MLAISFRSVISVVFSGALIISSLGTASQAATQKTTAPSAVAANGSSTVVLDGAGSFDPERDGGGYGSSGVLTSPDGQILYAQTYGEIFKVDVASLQILGRLALDKQPVVSTKSADLQHGYVVTSNSPGNENPQLEQFNLASGVVDRPILLTQPGSPISSPRAVSNANVPGVGSVTFVYSAGWGFYNTDPQLHAVDMTTKTVTMVNLFTSLGIAREAEFSMAVSADGTELYLANNVEIKVFNTADLTQAPTALSFGAKFIKVLDDDISSATNLGKIYALDESGMLRIIDPEFNTMVKSKQMGDAPRAFEVRSNGDAAASYAEPKIDFFDNSADVVVSETFPMVNPIGNGANAIGIAIDENATFGTCIFTANNGEGSFSAIGVDGADCGPFSNRIGSIVPTIEVNDSASLTITPPSNTSREKPWVGVGIFVDGVLDRVVKPPFGSSINLSWADLPSGDSVSIRSYSQAILDSANLASVDNVTFETGFVHERSTRLGFIGFEAESVASGGAHSCAIYEGSVYCWGENEDGQMGDSTDENKAQVTKVVNSASFTNTLVTQVVTGSAHTCAIAAGSVYCWGFNGSGELGSETNLSPAEAPTKVEDVAGGFQNSNVTGISAGGEHTCAIVAGSVYCWGDNNSGQLGDGTFVESNSAVKVSPVQGVFTNTGVTAVTTGFRHTCAVASGSLYCWGNNNDGELGNENDRDEPLPQKVVDVIGGFTNENVTAVSAGYAFTCAIASGVAYCWGLNEEGNLGDGDDRDRDRPSLVTDNPSAGFVNSSVTQIKTGEEHACLIKGRVMFCWGNNSAGRLGLGPDGDDTEIPLKVTTVQNGFTDTSVTSMSVGHEHTCAINAGKAYCWGEGEAGQLGNRSMRLDADTPGKVCCKVQSSNPSPPPTTSNPSPPPTTSNPSPPPTTSNPSPPPTTAKAVTYNAVPKSVGPNQKFKPVKNANGRTLKLKSSTAKICRVVGQQIVFVAPGTCRVVINEGSETLKTISTKVVAGVKPKGSVSKTSTANVFFAGNSAVLSSTAKADLRKLASKLKAADVVTVSGHAAYTGFFSSRSFAKTLSERRAEATAKYLRSLGVKVAVEVSYGSSAQVSKTLSKNRRVEIAWL